MVARSKWFLLGVGLLLPLLTGATCSTNAVAEDAARSFFGALAAGLGNAIVAGVTGG